MLANRLLYMNLDFAQRTFALPAGVTLLNPLKDAHGQEVEHILHSFHERYFKDDDPRVLMLGINPGRFGAGLTGIAFTDPGDLREVLEIDHNLPSTRPETSSQFFKRLVVHAGGPHAFYRKAYVHSVFPFGFTTTGRSGKEVNLNYYDRKDLEDAVRPHATQWLNGLVAAGCRKDIALCLGKGKNHRFLESLQLFDTVIPLEHPRFIMQYKAKQVDLYLNMYLERLGSVGHD